MDIGYYNPEGISRLTRICATENLLQMFPVSEHPAVKYKPVEVVELWEKTKTYFIHPETKRKRARKTKRLIDYDDTKETQRIREILTRANEINDKADIEYVFEKSHYKLNSAIKAKFTNSFKLGGRLYSEGKSQFQGYSKEDRQNITINGHSVVEMDYKALHPNLLYAGEGKQYFGDPYMVVDQRPEVRPFLKIILLCMVNNPTYTEAQRAANNWLIHKADDKTREQIFNAGIAKAKPLMDKFLEVHQPIKKYLCTSSQNGLKLMNKDAKIAVDIINHFAEQEIPILCIHDSFIVEEKYEDELIQVMRKTYRKHTGFRILVE
jgi:hypothetical protein